MDEFLVLLSNNAQKGLKKSEQKIKKRIIEVIDELKINPVPSKKFDVTKLSGSETSYRIRVINYRILYAIDWNKKQVQIFDIDKRKDRTYK